MDLLKYIIAGAIALVLGIVVWIMGNFLSGILIFILLFGGYIMWNVLQNVNENAPPEEKDKNISQDN
ncbi:hypothetical protein GX888_02880 [Candidatus Dojkabacteria bacterium]|uniref:Uncharacterized protein n=1 Tax=Candidatus Dojkabacteria bacterium TaxID=2099670 RepID=A0A847VDU5_9BACT|nr:hypothetical protein [Candidatus Dojkabacteria bacterium]